MRKVIAILLILLPSVVWATTYNIGPGQTYETFTALVAAETLTAGDIGAYEYPGGQNECGGTAGMH